MNDTDDAYRPIRIYDVDFNEGDSTYISLVLKEIEKNEEEGRTVTKYLSQAYLAYCGNVREGNYIRFYDFDNFRRNTEVKYGKNGNVLSATIRTTRNRKNGSRNFAQRDSYTRFSIAVDSEGHELSQGQQDYFKDSRGRDENGNLYKSNY
ncbi:MAG: hypothetical protein K6B67_05895 [Lachnospiraceae bacterium]|nr:hypothetical protein [Lachnospiraceae bacterium]